MEPTHERIVSETHGIVAFHEMTPVERPDIASRFHEVVLTADADLWIQALAALMSRGFMPLQNDAAVVNLMGDGVFLTGRTALTLSELKSVPGIDEAAYVVPMEL
jgi:hypothetical protein